MSFLKSKAFKVGTGMMTGAGMGAQFGAKAGYYTGDDYGRDTLGGAAVGSAVGAAVGGTLVYAGSDIVSSVGSALKNFDPEAAARGVRNTARGTYEVGKAVLGPSGIPKSVAQAGASLMQSSAFSSDLNSARNLLGGMVTKATGDNLYEKAKSIKLTNPVTGFKRGMQLAKDAGGSKLNQVASGVRGSILSGNAALHMGSLAKGLSQGAKTVRRINMGTMTPGVFTSKPAIPEYDDNSGATGDLVFALHKLR